MKNNHMNELTMEEKIKEMGYKALFEDGQPNYNAFLKALYMCAAERNEHIYDYIEKTPKTTFTVEMVDKLKEIGFTITKTQ